MTSARASASRSTAAALRRPGLYLAVATSGALMVNVLTVGQPAAHAGTAGRSVSVAQALGVASDSRSAPTGNSVGPLMELTASRSQREQETAAAAQVQQAADQARLAAEAAAQQAQAAAQQAQAAAAAKAQADAAAAAAAAAKPAAPAAPSGSFRDYAMGKVGNASQFSCLESLWGKESGWNPNAKNPSSTAYGIPQFLDSTWAATGVAKTSNGYRQIDAGLVYIDSRYGSPCGAWAHSRAHNWY
jgi:multidrug efflux pump subunit AcrA (membrane-fusion protein)